MSIMGCCSDTWVLVCTTPFSVNNVQITPRIELSVKYKFPGDDGRLKTGVWQVRDGDGGTFNLSYENRKKFFQ
jgi:hypothetical protein